MKDNDPIHQLARTILRRNVPWYAMTDSEIDHGCSVLAREAVSAIVEALRLDAPIADEAELNKKEETKPFLSRMFTHIARRQDGTYADRIVVDYDDFLRLCEGYNFWMQRQSNSGLQRAIELLDQAMDEIERKMV